MSFKLYYPTKAGQTTTVTLRNPERDNTEDRIRVQAMGRTRGGTVYAYDKGTSRIECEYQFTELVAADKSALDGFFASQANGQITAFQIDDHHGTTWNARFLQPSLSWVNIGELTPPTTDPVWSVSFRLQQWATS